MADTLFTVRGGYGDPQRPTMTEDAKPSFYVEEIELGTGLPLGHALMIGFKGQFGAVLTLVTPIEEKLDAGRFKKYRSAPYAHAIRLKLKSPLLIRDVLDWIDEQDEWWSMTGTMPLPDQPMDVAFSFESRTIAVFFKLTFCQEDNTYFGAAN